jgi:NADPH2:quinone reductase
MRSVVARSYGGPEVLEIDDSATPEPGAGEVRIAVTAAGLNPVDSAVRSGAFAAVLGDRFPIGFGWDVAGTVDAIGAGVAGVAIGDDVVAMINAFGVATGAHASHVIAAADAVAPAPAGVEVTAAATFPLNSLTADQALDLLDLAAGATVVVTGAAGGLGDFAVSLAARRGLRVIAVAGDADADEVRAAGASDFISRTADLADAVRALVPAGVDGLLDAAQIGAAALDAVRDGGSFVAVTDPSEPPVERGVTVQTVHVVPDGARLAELSRGAEEGWLRLRVAAVYKLDEAAAAHEFAGRGGGRGRVVFVP